MNLSFIKTSAAVIAVLCTLASSLPQTAAQTVYQTYRLETQTVYEQQPVTVYRLRWEDVEREVTTHRPVWENETRIRRVAKSVPETSTRVQKVTVRRPVMDTETRVRQHVVRQPITEQVMQTRQRVINQPVTTMQTQYVDQGQYVDQYVLQQGRVRNRLQWLQGGYVQNPATGTMVYQRGGLHWVPTQTPGRYQLQRQYVPNMVAQQVPVTTMQQQVVCEQVPVNVTRYEDRTVNEEYQVQVCKWVDEVEDREYQVTTHKIQYEDQPYEVKVCKWVPETATVTHRVAKWVPETTTRLVPRTVTRRVPVQTCSPCTTAYYAPNDYYHRPIVVKREPTKAQKPETVEPKEADSAASGQPNDDDPTGKPELESKGGEGRVTKNPVTGAGGDAAPAGEGEGAGAGDEAGEGGGDEAAGEESDAAPDEEAAPTA